MLPFPCIGVVFDIDALGGGAYGARAWRVFMLEVDPRRLCGSALVDGDTALTLYGTANEFCIGIYSPELDTAYIRDRFESSDATGLAPLHRRFIEEAALRPQPLPLFGRIDVAGRLVTEEWSPFDHESCREAGWGYAPESTPFELDPVRAAQLGAMAAVQ